ncbi:MAG: hypothetical protein ACRD11_04760 [Terriglobia bacterium]
MSRLSKGTLKNDLKTIAQKAKNLALDVGSTAKGARSQLEHAAEDAEKGAGHELNLAGDVIKKAAGSAEKKLRKDLPPKADEKAQQ